MFNITFVISYHLIQKYKKKLENPRKHYSLTFLSDLTGKPK